MIETTEAPAMARTEVATATAHAVQAQVPRQLTVVEYAVQSGASVAEVARLVELQIKMDEHKAAMRRLDDLRDAELRVEARAAAYAEAMAAFKAEGIRVIGTKERTDGPLKNTKYADLDDVYEAATAAMSKHGLSASWRPVVDEKDWIKIECVVKHVKGHSEAVAFGGPIDNGPGRNAMQARKSSTTYLERITMLMALGLVESGADDDGAGGGKDDGPPLGDVWKWKAQKAETADALADLWTKGVTVINKDGTRADYDTFKAAVFKRRAELAKAGQPATEGAAS